MRRIRAHLFDLSQRYGKDKETYEGLRGEAKALQWVLGEMDSIGVEPEEVEETDETIV